MNEQTNLSLELSKTTMVQQRSFVIADKTSKTMPLELQNMNIEKEWAYVMHTTIDEWIELNSFSSRLNIFTIGSKEKKFKKNMQRK